MMRSPAGLMLALVILFLPVGTASADDVFVEKLRRLRIEPTPAGVSSYLHSLIPGPDLESRVESLLNDLGSDRYEVRQQAMLELLNLPVPPIQQLEEAAQSPDAEIRARVRRIVAKAEQKGYQTRLAAALLYVEYKQVKGLAPVLVKLMLRIREPYHLELTERALRVTAELGDAQLLRREIATAPSPRKEAAVLALGTALGKDAVPELLPLLEHEQPAMRLAAAEALADLGRRESLPVLISLLESSAAEHRHRAVNVLRAVTGERFHFAPAGSEQSRGAAVADWRNWHREHGQTAKLTFPFPRKPVEAGRTLVCVWASKALIEVTQTKAEVFRVGGFKYVWGCHGTPDGRRLAVDAEQQAVFEYNEAGKETWRMVNLPGRPTSVEGLENGNVLIACSDSDRVIEVTRDGRLAWDFSIEGRPTTAQRLQNGHTVINLQNAGKVVEVDQQGNVTELVNGLDRAHTAERLDNGNILVTEMRLNRVDEYDRNGNIVWSKQGLKNPSQAQRLSNGNTLIADEEGLHEFDAQNNRVWRLEVTRSRFFRY